MVQFPSTPCSFDAEFLADLPYDPSVLMLDSLLELDGWIGYGTHIHKAVFRALMTPGTPVEATCVATRLRPGDARYAVRYRFEFRDRGTRYYEGDQAAFWYRTSSS